MDYNFDLEDKKPRAKRIIRSVIIWIIEIIFVVTAAYLIIAFGVEKTSMAGDSMESTLQDKDKIIINKMAYRFSNPKRFDVIVFKQSGKEHSYYNIKRVIGLPGETVQVINGEVYIDGKVLEEKIQAEPILNGGLADEEVVLDDNEYFVLGDNRNHSEDSRFANIGNILEQDIIGKAWIRLQPFDFINQMNTIPEPNETEGE